MSRRTFIVVVDPTLCDGHGVCHELLPEHIGVDRWGYPVISEPEVTPSRLAYAELAVEGCPRLALHLMERPR